MAKKIQGEKTIVTIVNSKGDSTLVQFVSSGVLSRKFVPTHLVVDNMVDDQVLARGIPYGYPWDDIEMKFDNAKFANELHNLDVWTVEDALKSPQKLWSALRAALADNLSTILETAKIEKKGVNRNG